MNWTSSRPDWSLVGPGLDGDRAGYGPRTGARNAGLAIDTAARGVQVGADHHDVVRAPPGGLGEDVERGLDLAQHRRRRGRPSRRSSRVADHLEVVAVYLVIESLCIDVRRRGTCETRQH